ncbi:MAG: ACP S-malonyltransferase [Candidatus Melainabacteria bacterium]|nr:ACP S-malonyltransferase [Candidatus Melainabacteria bacterium]MBI3308236.1 ACP S-malonyltransferase [Candidatus Melainabacteria bacterium]
MRFAILFPGQGSQKVGMGLDLFEQTKFAKEIFNLINQTANRNISDIFLTGSQEELNQTKNTQISLVAVSTALTQILQENLKSKKLDFKPFACCGHSLGELTCLWYTEIVSLKEVVELVLLRGNLMQEAPTGRMAAVLNIENSKISKLIKENDLSNDVVIANFNSPTQFVLSGNKDAINSLIPKFKLLGGKAIILPLSGAFHSPLMNKPAEIFSAQIDKLLNQSRKNAKIPIYQNLDGEPSTDSKTILEKLRKQMISPVLWTQTINNLVNDNVRAFIEIGPGKILTGLVKKVNPEVECYNIFDLESLNNFVENYECKFLSTKNI